MKSEIRDISHSDFPAIHELYKEIYPNHPRKVKPLIELVWLFTDPDDKNKLNGYVAFDENNKLVGVIGYVVSKYTIDNTTVSGVISRSWMVSPKYRGILGLQLLLKVIKLADFAFTIQGSVMAQSSYKAVKLKHIFDAHVYYKVFNPIKFFLSSEKKSIKESLRGLYYYSFFPSLRTVSKNLTLVENDKELPVLGKNHEQFSIVESHNRINWLMQCPMLDSFSYTIYDKNEAIGIALCYLRRISKKLSRARIVYISYLGQDTSRWIQIIGLLEKSLREKGCCSLSVFASNSIFVSSLEKLGYRTSQRSRRSVYIRDDNNVLQGIPLNEWYLTYYEGDKGYRDI